MQDPSKRHLTNLQDDNFVSRKKNGPCDVPARRITADDVAAMAGVSASAVSRTFTPGASASVKTRERVLKAARSLGYRPNIIARSLRAGRTTLIGVLVADFGNPWHAMALDHLTATLQRHGLHALLFNVGSGDMLTEILPMVLQFQVDALILASTEFSPLLADSCEKSGVPVISFGRYGSSRLKISAVSCDDPRAGKEVADLLFARGYRRYAYVAGEEAAATWTNRYEGFAERTAAYGIPPVEVFAAGKTSYSAGLAAAKELLDTAPRPDAIFCQNDILAMGVLDGARSDFGLSVPEELGVVGFDDIPVAGQRPYALTTVRQPFQAMIDLTVRLTIEQIAEETVRPGSPSIHLLPGTLIERSTVRGG
jgi:DNA-binding LacI/PurR family transcriptional regulator